MTKRILDFLFLVFKGFCIGAADVVPGVSGGTMAFILGIYEELIHAIRSFNLRLLKLIFTLKFREVLVAVPWGFLLALAIGILAAVFSLAKGLSWMLQNQPILIWSFFFGMIVASAFAVRNRMEEWTLLRLVVAVLGAVGTYYLVGMVPMRSGHEPWYLFMCGAVAICATLLPGISGSFVLVLLGKYTFILHAVNTRNFTTLAIVGAGAALGMMIFSRVLNWLFRRYYNLTIALLCGLMVGSLRKVWPWKSPYGTLNLWPTEFGTETKLALVLAIAGAVAVLIMETLGPDREK